MKLDERTFGDSPAAVDMARIINEKGLNPRKPARLLARFDKIIADLNQVDLTTAIHLMHLVYKESLDKCETFEEPLNTFTQNILSTKFKKWQIRKNALGLKKNRKS
jgi:hypothetical protein